MSRGLLGTCRLWGDGPRGANGVQVGDVLQLGLLCLRWPKVGTPTSRSATSGLHRLRTPGGGG